MLVEPVVRETDPGLRLSVGQLDPQLGPEFCVKLGDRETGPVNPRLLTVTVEVDDAPGGRLTGFAVEDVMVKSDVTVKVTVAVCVRGPLLAVTVIV